MAFVYKVLKLCKEKQRVCLVALSPAGVGAFMACWSRGVNLYEQRVVVTVVLYAYQVKEGLPKTERLTRTERLVKRTINIK
jgi:hypothetical protein